MLALKRADLNNTNYHEDPIKELEQVYIHIDSLESNMSRCLEMSTFINEKNKELITETEQITYQLETS